MKRPFVLLVAGVFAASHLATRVLLAHRATDHCLHCGMRIYPASSCLACAASRPAHGTQDGRVPSPPKGARP